MPIPAPILDDRSYQQLRDELVRRIPVYTPEWTDHNASDPGITLIELFAFLGENLLFRFNQIPETTKLAFLRLLQIPLLPAVSARCMLAMTTEEADGALVIIGAEARAGSIPFETVNEVEAWPISVVAAGRVTTAAPDPASEPEPVEFALRALDAIGGLKPEETPAYYATQLLPTDDAQPAVDFKATVDGMLWVAVLAEKGFVPQKFAGSLINIGFVPDAVIPSIDQVKGCPGAGVQASGPAVEWEISTGIIDGKSQPIYKSLAVEGDTTRGLGQQGIVRLRLPGTKAEFGVFPAADEDLKGTGNRPPVLDESAEAKLVCWLRAYRHDGSHFDKVRSVTVNAAEAMQSRKALPEFLGTGSAQANQVYKLGNRPVLDRSVVLEVEENGAWRRWSETDAFHASTSDDRHFIVDRESGDVHFGTGVQGMAPQIGQRIRVLEYRYGGGAAGNVSAKAISGNIPAVSANVLLGIIPVQVKVMNPQPAFGGGETETIEAALERIPGELRRRDRAVTSGDFQELALETPGANVGRAECLPRFHPPTRTPERAGVVSVVVWPKDDKKHPNAPVPDENLRRTVCEWLDQRRLVTTELYVIPPTYRKVALSVGLRVKPGYGIEAVRRWVELVLRQYLAPLPPFGPDGGGWPLGRRVYGPELEAAALQVEGVEFLETLKVAGWDEKSNAWLQGPVELAIYEVPEVASITVVDGPAQDPPGAIGAPPTGQVAVPIPIVRQVC
jgi:hypothetical protein